MRGGLRGGEKNREEDPFCGSDQKHCYETVTFRDVDVILNCVESDTRFAYRPDRCFWSENMAGRHLKPGQAPKLISRTGFKGVAGASVAGTVLGVAMPAFAAPQPQAPAGVEVSASTVRIADTAKSFSTPKVSIRTALGSDPAGFSLPAVNVKAEAAPAAPAPAAQPAPAARTDAAAPVARNVPAAKTAPAPAPVPASGRGAAIAAFAGRFSGVAYVSGGETPAGWDCSGFTKYVFAQFGVNLAHKASAQRSAGTVVSASQAQPGDLVWWPGHIGIYLGGGKHIAARRPGVGTVIGSVYGNPQYIRVM